MTVAFILIVSLLARGTEPEPPAVRTERLSVVAQVVCALEGGPLLLKVDVANTSKKRLKYYSVSSDTGAAVDPPTEWRPRLRVRTIFSSLEGTSVLEPGERLSTTLYLHHEYANILAGKVNLRVFWTLPHPEKHEISVAEGSTLIQVVIPPATEANVGAVRQRLLVELDRLDKLEKTEQTWMEYRRVADHIRYAHHPGLIPVAFRLLRVPDGQLDIYYSKHRLVEDIYASARQPQQAHDLFLKHVLSDNPVAAEKVFDFWRGLRWTASPGYVWERVPSLRDVTVAPVRYLLRPDRLVRDLDRIITHVKARRMLLPDESLRRLCGARNVWIKALTYLTFGERCERAWTTGLLRELRRKNTPLQARELDALLRQLDASSFAVRERASAELLRLADGVEPDLRQALKRPLSPEAARRVKLVLSELEKEDFDPLRKQALAYLGSIDRPESRAVLATLAEGRPDARLTREARAALQQLDQRKARPR